MRLDSEIRIYFAYHGSLVSACTTQIYFERVLFIRIGDIFPNWMFYHGCRFVNNRCLE